MKLLSAVFFFNLVWLIVTFFCSIAMTILFGYRGLLIDSGPTPIGFGIISTWQSWPGNILGILLGFGTALDILRETPEYVPLNPKRRSLGLGGDNDNDGDSDGGADSGGGDGGDGGD